MRRTVRALAGSLAFTLLACGHASPEGTQGPSTSPAPPSPTTSSTPPPSSTPSAVSGAYYSADDLTAAGWTIEDIGQGRRVVCKDGGEDDGERCFCWTDLPCAVGHALADHDPGACLPCQQPHDGSGGCISRDENVQVFRDAMSNIACERAELGTCDSFEYFDFEGDVYRYELRFFEGGHLVGQRNWTDYNEYCGGRTLTRWMGAIPRCTAMTSTELLCGEAHDRLHPPSF